MPGRSCLSPQSLGSSSNPTLVPKSPTKGKELQSRQLRRRRCTCPLDYPHSAWHLAQMAFLYPTAHSPAYASSWVPPRLPQLFAELIVQHVADEILASIHC